MLNRLLEHKKIIALILGILSVYALPPFYIFPVLFFTFSALLLILNSVHSYKKAFAVGYWFGFGFFAVGLSWIGNALLIDITTFGWLYPIVILASGAFFGLFTALPAILSNIFRGIYAKWLAFASLWVLSEWLRSFLLTGFPWNLIGSTLTFSTLTMQGAAVLGTYGLSLAVLMITMAPALFIEQKNLKSLIISFSAIFTISGLLLGYGYWHLRQNPENKKSNITVRIVQPSIPQTMKWSRNSLESNFDQYIELSKQEGLNKADFVIWGETASAFALDMDREHMTKILQAVPDKGYLITGLVRYEYSSYGSYSPLNSMFIINKYGEIEDSYDKSHLVPFGEYIPLRQYLPAWIKPVTGAIANFKAGSGPKRMKVGKYPSLGGLICYEVIFPAQIVDKHKKPKWIVNLTNDGWYGDSQGPYQHLAMTQLRAVEEGITIVRVANTGISAIIAPTGKILDSIPLNKSAVLDSQLPKNMTITTFYGKYYNLLIILLCLVNISISCYIHRKHL